MSGEIIVIAEKPELARAIAEGLGGGARQDGFIDCGRHYVTWAIGHMLELVDPQDPWNMAALPISFIPELAEVAEISLLGVKPSIGLRWIRQQKLCLSTAVRCGACCKTKPLARGQIQCHDGICTV